MSRTERFYINSISQSILVGLARKKAEKGRSRNFRKISIETWNNSIDQPAISVALYGTVIMKSLLMVE